MCVDVYKWYLKKVKLKIVAKIKAAKDARACA